MVAALGLSVACTDDATRLAEHLEAAEGYEAEQEWDAAWIELAGAIRLAPQNAAINLRLAQVESNRSRPGEALFYFEEAYRLDPENVEAATGIVGLVVFADLERAQGVVAEIRERRPSDPRVHMAIALVALLEEDTPKALAAALTAVELEPGLPTAHLQLGLVHVAEIRELNLRKKEVPEELFGEAVASFVRTRELALGDTASGTRLRAWTEEAKVYARWPNHRAQIQPTLAEAYEDLRSAPLAVRQELMRGALDLARRLRQPPLIRWALEHTVEVDSQNYLAWGDLAHRAEQEDGTGVEVVERLIAERPDDPRAHAIYGRMLSQTGATEQAIAHLEKVAGELDGNVSFVLQRLLELQLQQDDLEGARATRTEMVARYPDAGATFQASAQLASSQGDIATAVDWLSRWIDRSENLIALRMLSTAELSRGNAKAALAAADRALELARQLDVRRRPFLCLRGKALSRLGQHTLALRVLVQARGSLGTNVEGCVEALAGELYASGRDKKALEVLEQMLKEPPSRASVLLFAARESERDPQRARALLEALVALRPTDMNARARLLKMDLAAGETEAAVARARASVAAHPDSAGMHVLLGRTLAAAEQTDEAVQVLEATLERWPSIPGTSNALIALLGHLGRLDELLQTLEQLHTEGNLTPGSQVTLARMRIRAGDDPGAIELLESALEANPRLAAAANDLAYLLARTGDDLERATELAQVARGQEPESGQIADTLGWIFHRRGLTHAALVQFDEAIDLAAPQSGAWATANYHRALALRELDRNEEALDAVARALASGADFPEAEDAKTVIQELSVGTS